MNPNGIGSGSTPSSATRSARKGSMGSHRQRDGAPSPVDPFRSQECADEAQDFAGLSEAAEMALVGHQDELRVGQELGGLLGVVERDDGVGVAVPPSHRDLDVRQPKTPIAPEESGVVDQGL